MRAVVRAVAVSAVPLAALLPDALAAQARPRLDGAWRRVSQTLTAPDTTASTTYAQPSVYLFVDGYFSLMAITAREPRERLGTPPSDAEKARAFDGFIAQSGRYAVTGRSLKQDVLIARAPNAEGTSRTSTMTLRGDTLVLATPARSPKDTTKAAEVRTTYVRLR